MATSSFLETTQSADADATWVSLRQAIANTSGFRRWQIEKGLNDQSSDQSLDQLVQRYLRETLETLAY